jgi:hypothetical protein
LVAFVDEKAVLLTCHSSHQGSGGLCKMQTYSSSYSSFMNGNDNADGANVWDLQPNLRIEITELETRMKAAQIIDG